MIEAPIQANGDVPSNEEPIQEHGQSRNNLDQIMEQNILSEIPLNAQEYPGDDENRDTQIEETTGDFQDVTEDLTAVDSTPMLQEALLNTEVAAHQQTRDELIQLKAKIRRKDSRLQTHEHDLREATGIIEQLRDEQDDLQTRLDTANSQISKFDDAYRELSTKAEALETQVDDQAVELGIANFYKLKLFERLCKQTDGAREGLKELKFFKRLGLKLYTRLQKAEKLLKGALGRDGGLMRLAEQRLPKPSPSSVKKPVFTFGETSAQESQQKVEGATKKPVFEFGGTPTQEPQRKAEDTTKNPLFEFGGTNAQESQQKAEGAAKKPLFQFSAPPVQEARQEKPLGATTSPQGLDPTQKTAVSETSGVQDSTHNHTFAPSAPRVSLSTPVTLKAEGSKPVGIPVDPIARRAKEPEREYRPVGGKSLVDYTRSRLKPRLNGKADSGIFNLTPKTDFNFRATNTFKAGPDPFVAASKAFGIAKEDEQEEGPIKETGTASNLGSPSSIDLSSSSSIGKEEDEAPGTATKDDEKKHQSALKTQPFPMFGAGISNQFYSSPSEVKTTFDGFESVSAGTSIAPFTNDNQAEAVSPEPTQGFSSTLPVQLPGLSVGPDSSSSVHSAPTTTGSTETGDDHQQSENRMGEKENVGALQEVTGAPNNEVSRTSSTPLSTSEDRMEREATNVFGKLVFDTGAPTHIVISVTPPIQENLGGDDLSGSLVPPRTKVPSQIEANEPGRYLQPGPFRAAAEIIAVSTLTDGVNAQDPPTASIPWRESVWSAELPPWKPEPEWSAELTRLAGTPTALTKSHQPQTSTQGAIRRKYIYQNIEEAIDAIMGGIASLHIGSEMSPRMQRCEPYVLLSGDWIARQCPICRTIEREVDDIENKVETGDKSLTQSDEAREVEVTSEDVRYEHEVARESEPDVLESPTLTQPEIGNREASTTEAGEAQGAMADVEQEQSAELEVAVETEQQETGSATQSNVAPQGSLQMRAQLSPQMGTRTEEQIEDTVTAAQAPESIAGPSSESQEQNNDTPPPKKPSGGLRIWSMKKQPEGLRIWSMKKQR